MTHFQLTSDQTIRTRALIDPALAFLNAHQYKLGTALVEHHWRNAPASEVLDELAGYQNEDGGFGRNLEVDIEAPASNPFAARLAMDMLLSLRDRPASPMIAGLETWLRDHQDPDGDWHFSAGVYDGKLPPWFAAWTFPSLNPACCLVGLANQLGMATPEMLERVAHLFAEKSSLEEVGSGEFYDLLPYVEYLGGVGDAPNRETWLDAVARRINEHAGEDGFADAGHFFELALGGGPDLVRRIPVATFTRQTDRLLAEAESDGGWPSAYDAAWRPTLTASAMTVLARLQHGVG